MRKRNLTSLRHIVLSWIVLVMPSAFAYPTQASLDSEQRIQAVVNGQLTTITQPWLAGLIWKSSQEIPPSVRQFCGGALIAPDWVLTAAHCVDDQNADDISVVIGSLNLDDPDAETIDVAEIIIHPRFRRDPADTDIALLRLVASSSNTPIALPTPSLRDTFLEQKVTFSGWGMTFDARSFDCRIYVENVENVSDYTCLTANISFENHPRDLYSTELQLHAASVCADRLKTRSQELNIPASQPGTLGYLDEQSHILCTWRDPSYSSLCYGDSGSPLIAMDEQDPVLIGVASTIDIKYCKVEQQTVLFTDVSAYLPFIEESMQRDPSYSFEQLCPPLIKPIVTYEKSLVGNNLARVSWNPSSKADQYTLYYLPAGIDAAIKKRSFGKTIDNFSIELKSGSHILIALQGSNANCDGPISSVQEVNIP